MTAEWMAENLMAEWANQSLPRSKERTMLTWNGLAIAPSEKALIDIIVELRSSLRGRMTKHEQVPIKDYDQETENMIRKALETDPE